MLIEIEQIDDLALEIWERYCCESDYDERQEALMNITDIIIEHLRPHIKGAKK